jgi:AraC-like DNA-binding protein
MQSDYDLKKMNELLMDFNSLTGIKICIYDRNENELCYYPEKYSSYCQLIRKDKRQEEKCKACDKFAFKQCKTTHKQYTYTCHAGLIECISPILVNGAITGYIAIGQIRTDNANIETDDPILKKEYDKLPVIPQNKIASSMRILDACTGYEFLSRFTEKNASGIDTRIDEYIANNIERTVTAQELQKEFHISHNELYLIFKQYFDTTPAEYIKRQRLLKAQKLLKSTRLPINEIALKCGIPDYNYFSKVFKKEVGISPREYRKS